MNDSKILHFTLKTYIFILFLIPLEKQLSFLYKMLFEENSNSDAEEGFGGNGELEAQSETETLIENFKSKN